MHDAAAGRHPLHAAGLQQALVAGVVAVAHAARDHVRHRLEAAVRMIGEAGQIVIRVIAAEGIEHQERIEPALQRLGQHAREPDARAVRGGVAGDDAFDAAGVFHAGLYEGVHSVLLNREGICHIPNVGWLPLLH